MLFFKKLGKLLYKCKVGRNRNYRVYILRLEKVDMISNNWWFYENLIEIKRMLEW